MPNVQPDRNYNDVKVRHCQAKDDTSDSANTLCNLHNWKTYGHDGHKPVATCSVFKQLKHVLNRNDRSGSVVVSLFNL